MANEVEKTDSIDVALVLAIDSYSNLQQLPGCAGDLRAINGLLHATARFAEVFQFGALKTSSAVRDQLRDFHLRYKDKKIRELFFYFSGHGAVIADEFIFCTSDFDSSSPRSTSLPKSEIDDLFRSLNPKLMVHVIDACNSGKRVIKEGQTFEKLLGASLQNKAGFSDVIQFASCMEEQSSFANEKISYFTREFMAGVQRQNLARILYRDIQNHLSDAFSAENEQKPYFIQQATGQEVFCENSEQAREFCGKILDQLNDRAAMNVASGEGSLKELIELRGKEFVSLPTAQKAIEDAAIFLRGIRLPSELEGLYAIQVDLVTSYSGIPAIRAIAQNLSDVQGEKPLVQVIGNHVEVEPSPYEIQIPQLARPRRTVWKPSGIDSKIDLTPNQITVTASPTNLSLSPLGVRLVIIPFRTKCRVYGAVVRYIRKGWDDFSINGADIRWEQEEFLWNELSGSGLKSLIDRTGFDDMLVKQTREVARMEIPQKDA